MADNEKKNISAETKEKDRHKKGKKTWLKILCILLAAAVAVGAFVVVKNWSNIKAFYLWRTKSSEQLQDSISKAQESQVDAISNTLPADKPEVNRAVEAINRGDITPEQFREIILGNLTVDQAVSENYHAVLPDTYDIVINDPNPEATTARDEGKITENQYIQVVVGNISLEDAIEEKSNPQKKDENKQQNIQKIETEKKVEIDEKVKDAYKSDKISIEQVDKITANEITLEQAIKDNKEEVVKQTVQFVPKDVTEENSGTENSEDPKVMVVDPNPEATTALDNGKITEGQYTQVVIGNMSLEQAIEETANPEKTEQKKEEQIKEIQDNKNVQVESNVKEAFKEDKISIEQVDKIADEELTLKDAIKENKDEEIKQTVQPVVKQPQTPTAPNTQTNPVIPPSGNQTDNSVNQNNNGEYTPPYNPGVTTPEQTIPSQNVQTPEQVTPSDDKQGSSDDKNVADKNEESSIAGSADVDQQIAALVTEMYVLKSQYESSVMGFVNQMKAEYLQNPRESRTTSLKASIATKYISNINAAEAQCDAQVNSIIAELKQILKANDRDTALADAIYSTYVTEKENTKAYCLSQYGD